MDHQHRALGFAPADTAGIVMPRATAAPMIAIVASFCVLAAVMGLSLPTNHDEYQYVAAAHLFRDARLYADFFYSQTPYFPAVLSGWLWLTEGVVGSTYVAARLFNIAWSVVFIVALFQILLRLSPSRSFAVAVGAALLSVEITSLPLRVARNDMMPLALTTVALALLVQASSAQHASRLGRAALHLAVGMLIAAAVGTKQSYAFIAVTVTLHAAFAPHLPLRERWATQVLPLAIGGVLGAVPMLVMVSANPTNFLYSVSDFHRTHHLWWSAPTPEAHATLTSLLVRSYVLFRVLANAPFVVMALAFVACLVAALMVQRAKPRPGDGRLWSLLLLSAGTVIAGLPFFLLAIPLHPQYVAPILPFIGVCAVTAAALMQRAVADELVRDCRRALPWAATLLLAGTLTYGIAAPQRGAIAHIRSVLQGMSTGTEGGFVWGHAERVGARINAVLGASRPDLRIATVMSIYPLEAGFGIYRELASAPFFYQTNDLIPIEQVRSLIGTSPATMREWLVQRDVRAVLVGYRKDLDAPLRAHAQARGFLCFRVDLRDGQADQTDPGPGELWVAPELTRAEPDCGGD